jgi:hypothetical protein
MKRNRKSRRNLVRGLISLSVVMVVCALMLPLPVSPWTQDSAEKDTSEPFPCQNRPCGCRSAMQCWKKCCCFNNTQKIAWAKANNVLVPAFVLAARETEKTAEESKDGNSSPEICSLPRSHVRLTAVPKSPVACQHCRQPAADVAKTSHDRNVGTPTVAESPSDHGLQKKAQQIRFSGSRTSSRWVLAVYAAECQGQGLSTFCFPVSIIPDRPQLVSLSVDVVEPFLIESERLPQSSLRPPLPPPKII